MDLGRPVVILMKAYSQITKTDYGSRELSYCFLDRVWPVMLKRTEKSTTVLINSRWYSSMKFASWIIDGLIGKFIYDEITGVFILDTLLGLILRCLRDKFRKEIEIGYYELHTGGWGISGLAQMPLNKEVLYREVNPGARC